MRRFNRMLLALLTLVLAGIAAAPAGAARITVPAALLAESGDLQELVIDYKATLPGVDSQAFVQPTPAEADTVVAAAQAARAGDLAGAAATLDPLGDDLVAYQDTGGSGEHLILRERVPCARCWGLYVLSRAPAACNVLVEVPHPLFDVNTPELGIEAYVRSGAGAFLMAGTHRYANGRNSLVSDMARNPSSVFQRLHQALSNPGTHALNYHGFAQPDPPYPAVVLSSGSRQAHPELFALQAALQAHGESAGVYEGVLYPDLAGGVNPQGQYTRAIGGRFYHMEHERALRQSPTRRSNAVSALLAVLGTAPSCPSRPQRAAAHTPVGISGMESQGQTPALVGGGARQP
jgi:hypothetical protein